MHSATLLSMTAPTESVPQPVPGHPPWAWWPGVGGRLVYARLLGSHPPVVLRDRNYTALLARIRRAEGDGDDRAD